MSKGVGQPGYRVRFRPGEVRPSRRGRRIRGFQELFVGVTRAAYWVGLTLLLLYALYQSYFLIYETSYLRLENVLVSGNQVLTKQEILGLTGIELGSHFFKYKPKEIKTVLL
ncbi:MAG: FtsQ-type POTRA domain-containing protein, partial [Candidatus Wallbacteria bacterium]|nr:FtsQ-type POTRA domain-containing protein [Candidatus Wallbacteria bacterium]